MKSKLLVLIWMLITTSIAFAQNDAEAEGQDDLAAAAQNPISSMVSIPFQFNFNFGLGQFNRTQTVINLQPVIPYQMTEKWSIVNRVIIPIIAQPDVTSERGSTGGIGNTNYTAFFVPPAVKRTSIGFGPSFILPTRTNNKLGTPEFGMGPSIVLFSGAGKWTFGFVTAQNWSWVNSNLSTFFVQYFINYNLPKGRSVGSAPTISTTWKAADGEQWIVPVGLNVGKIQKLGKQASKLSLAGDWNAITPTGGPNWHLQFSFTLLFPTKG